MAYSGRHRYKTRREKLARNNRNLRMIVIFALLALLVLVYKNRWPIYDWWKTFFY